MKSFLAIALLALHSQAWAVDQVPRSAAVGGADIVMLTGHASATGSGGQARGLNRGDRLYSGDVINTGAGTYLNMRFPDGAFVLLRPNSRFQIESYAYSAADASLKSDSARPGPAAPVQPALKQESQESALPAAASPAVKPHAFFRLLRGGFRAVSGFLGHGDPGSYRISTPVATIGIRGTEFVVIHVNSREAGDPAFGDAAPDGAASGGTVVGVIKGGIFISNDAGNEMSVSEGHFALTLPDGSQVFLPFEPSFLKLEPIPSPLNSCQ